MFRKTRNINGSDMDNKIILASGSPRRIEMLKNAGFDPIIIPADIDESIDSSLSPAEIVKDLARQKSRHVKEKILGIMEPKDLDEINDSSVKTSYDAGQLTYDARQSTKSIFIHLLSGNMPIIAADTIVYYDTIIGKPKDKNDALNILMKLSGNEHKVYTGVSILSTLNENTDISFTEETSVYFKKYSEDDLADYLNTDEPYDKAGAYAIQGYFSRFIDHIEGDYDNVVGLPLTRLIQALKGYEF